MTINLNEVAARITMEEAGKVNMSVAQVKEVLAVLGRQWRTMSDEDALAEFNAIRVRAGKKN